MSEASNSEKLGDELRDEYDFTPEQLRGAARGKYAERYARGINLEFLTKPPDEAPADEQ